MDVWVVEEDGKKFSLCGYRREGVIYGKSEDASMIIQMAIHIAGEKIKFLFI